MNYTPTQLEAISLFQNLEKIEKINTIKMLYGTVTIFEEDAIHLEDVFRMAEENGLKCSITPREGDSVIHIYSMNHANDGKDFFISYNPLLPLLKQSEETLQKLIKLFK